MFSFEDVSLPVPNEVVLDTSFVINVLIAAEPLHFVSQAYMTRLAAEKTTVYYNRLLELEVAEVAFKLAFVEKHGRRDWKRKRGDGRVRRRAGRLSDELRAAWAQLLTAVPHLMIELDEVADGVPTIMTKYGLESYDAAHAATATYVGAGGLVTTDSGFGRVPANVLPLYVDTGRVRTCRRHRGGK